MLRVSSLISVLLLISSATTSLSAQEPRSLFEFTVDRTEDNQQRIQKHLRQLVVSLRARNVSHLAPEQQANRCSLLDRLDAYWREGVFPRNHRYPGLRPVFIDGGNRACAVADLMIHSGAEDLACRVATAQNYAYLPDIKVPGVAEWVAASGLSLDECAMIQPAYPCTIFSGSNCSVQGISVTVTWQVNYTAPPNAWLFGYVRRDGVDVFSWSMIDPGIFVDDNVSPGVHTYEVYWEEALVCYDTATCTVLIGDHYVRGDVSGDGSVTPLAESIYLLNWGFAAGPAPVCMAAADIDGNGSVQAIVDAVYFLTYQFVNGPPPPEPFASCGAVPPPGGLDCLQPPACP